MTDTFSVSERSAIMSKVKGKNTKPEIALRKKLFAHGFRYRLHDNSLPGKPDIVFSKYKSVIFVHGCFWHSHGCSRCRMPKTNSSYWRTKIRKNVERDGVHIRKLKKMGWRVLVVWECSLGKMMMDKTLNAVINWLRKSRRL